MTRDEQPILYAMLDSFLDSGVISEVMEFVKGGKEATVFRCRVGEWWHIVAARSIGRGSIEGFATMRRIRTAA